MPCRGILLILCLLSLALGCGPDRPATYPVRGRVVFPDGSPVRTGTVELLSQDHGTTATGSISDDGAFVLGTFTEYDGACAGQHDAIVVQFIINDGVTIHTRDHGDPVDPRFASYDSSGLTVDVRAVEQNDITLTVEKKRDR